MGNWILFIASLLLVLIVPVGLADAYKDVPSSHWAYDAVETLSRIGVITGFPDGTFRGNEMVTRFQIAILMYKFYNIFDSRITELNQRLSNIEAKVLTADTKTSLVPSQSKDFSSDIASLKVSIESLSKDVSKIISDIKSLSDSISKISTSTSESKANYENLKKSVDESNAKYSTLLKKVEDLQSSYNSIKTSLSTLEQKVSNTEASLNSNIARLDSSIQSLKDEIAKLERNNSQDLSDKVDYLEEQLAVLKSLKQETDIIKAEIASIKEGLKKLNIPVSEISTPSSAKSTENDAKSVLPVATMENELDYVFSSVENLRQNILSLVESLKDTVKIDEYQKVLDEIRNEMDSINTKIKYLFDSDEQLKEKLNSIVSQMREMVAQVETGISQEKSTIKTVPLEDVKQRSEILKSVIEEVKSEVYASAEFKALIASLSKLSELESKFVEISNRLDIIEQKIKTQNDSLLADEIEKVKQNVKSLKDAVEQLKSVSVSDENIQSILQRLDAQDKNIKTLLHSVEELSQKISMIDEKFNNLAHDSLKEARQVSVTTSTQYDATINEIKGKLAKVDEELQKKASIAQINSVNQSVQKVLSMVLDLSNEVKNLSSQINALSSTKDSSGSSNDVNTLKEIIEIIGSKIDSLNEEQAKVNETIKQLMEQLELLKSEIKRQSEFEVYKELENSMRLIQQETENLKITYKQLSQEMNQFAKKEETDSLWMKVEVQEKNINELSKSINDIKSGLENIIFGFNEHFERFDTSLNQMTDNLNGLVSSVENYNKLVENVKNDIAVLCEKYDQVESEIGNAKVHVEDIEKRLKEAEKQVSQIISEDFIKGIVSKDMFETALNDLKAYVDEKINTYEAKLTAYIDSKTESAVKIMKEEILTKLMNTETKMYSLIDENTKKIQDTNEDLESTMRKLEELVTRFDTFSFDTTRQASEIQNRLDVLEKQLETLKKEKSDLENRQNTLILLLLIAIGLGIAGIVVK
ncbi:MAG: S-layer homology domain-containing protein [Fervidobacterium sp.]